MQSRLGSLYEALINTTIGCCVGLLSQLVVFPMFDIHIPISSNLGILACFTTISIVRGYVIRRWFNARIHAAAMKLSGRANA